MEAPRIWTVAEAKAKWGIPDHILMSSYSQIGHCQIPGMRRLSQAACYMRQGHDWSLKRQGAEETTMRCKQAIGLCEGCQHEVSALTRKLLQKAIKAGFRFDGKTPLANGKWVIKDGDKETEAFFAQCRRMGFATSKSRML